ncbi:MAG: NFACT family protein, partial [Clostridia bacterium]|nr:NFACT family protein [Clostridia bacterium]
MAFDALMATAVTRELKANIVGAKAEKIYQPSKDEIIISCRAGRKNIKLVVSANPSSARVSLTEIERENPKTPPMFCMLLRKHLVGTTVEDVYMYGFERIIEIKFKAYDELGFPTEKYLTTEIMGKSSNIFLLGGNEKKILGVLHPGDITTPSKRRVIVGAPYELPPLQQKADPNTETEDDFIRRLSESEKERAADKYIVETYLGISPLVAREIAYRA